MSPPRNEPDAEERWEEEPEIAEPSYRRRRTPVPVRSGGLGEQLRRLRSHGGLWLGLAALLVGAALAARLFFFSGWFVLSGSDQIAVHGNQAVSAEQVRGLFGGDLGHNIFFIPLEQRRRELAALAWVRTARLERIWPNRLVATITERTPVALARAGDGLALIDADGMLLQPAAGVNYDFPVVNGLSGAGADLAAANSPANVYERQQQMQRYLAVRDALDQKGADHTAEISEMDLHDAQDTQLLATPPGQEQPILIHLGDHDFLARYQKVLAHIGEWRSNYPGLPWVDLRYDGQLVLPTPPAAKPAPAAEKAAAKAGRGGHD